MRKLYFSTDTELKISVKELLHNCFLLQRFISVLDIQPCLGNKSKAMERQN